MTTPALPKTLMGVTTLLIALAWTHGICGAQGQEALRREAFFRAVADHFQVPEREVTIIGDWDLSPDEVPVVLFVARRAGVSPDALIGFRRRGTSWMDLGTRFGLTARTFHVDLSGVVSLGPLARAAEEFRSRPGVEWGRIRLEDQEIVAYVNLMVLSEQAQVPSGRVLEAWTQAGSFMAAYSLLRDPRSHRSPS